MNLWRLRQCVTVATILSPQSNIEIPSRPVLIISNTSHIWSPTRISLLGNHSLHHQQYADDLQLFISLSASDPASSILQLESCLSDIHYWLCLNGLCLNPDNTKVILLGNRQRSQTFPALSSVVVANNSLDASDKITILGVAVVQHLSMDAHVSSIRKAGYYHIKAIKRSPLYLRRPKGERLLIYYTYAHVVG